mmetsp:Transcript_15177/g.28532  ORF Transcript_15177/g.28532 Transcript_15177/m.28532 type:complete len:530 (-) Transcript_15177:65-1654(-)|eukprot:CAMPEP_0176478410 /NCGR_PEP_ID=MMETSP0200_2-20121128/1172_1 /TAXON_ID=947934 /ORGANISM="Chaetoceros sp., Strain GSL56" /LENGTH=529 /DNA_ID=CAMNT_0017874347 /DNA_START=221 /DNA_END=1810 /DNA_ORIENTATION=-
MKRRVEHNQESSRGKKKRNDVMLDDGEYHGASSNNVNEKDQLLQSSAVLGCILGKQQSNLDDFLKETYQKLPSLYRISQEDRESCEVLKMLYSMGWEGVSDLLHSSQSNLDKITSSNTSNTLDESNADESMSSGASRSIDSNTLPLFFRNQEPLQLDEIKNIYGNSPFAAYLDGCSIVNNHADLLSASLASLCLDIQKSLPHAYINTYLTPPKAAAVSAHADDRDVFVIQVMGEKQWKVYGKVPIPYPSANEQVGKNGLPIPDHVIQDAPMYDITLQPGDVLYIPRGFVHEASTSILEPSFHCTVALATHDWSLSTILSNIVQNEVSNHARFRMALHPDFGRKELCSVDKTLIDGLSNLIHDAVECITSKFTVEHVANILETKFKAHNDNVQPIRQSLMDDYYLHAQTKSATVPFAETCSVVGPIAAKYVGMKSTIRASTPEERSMAPLPIATHGRGLTVREEICDALLYVLDILKENETMVVQVSQLRGYLSEDHMKQQNGTGMICDLSILSFVKCCVELGALTLLQP